MFCIFIFKAEVQETNFLFASIDDLPQCSPDSNLTTKRYMNLLLKKETLNALKKYILLRKI